MLKLFQILACIGLVVVCGYAFELASSKLTIGQKLAANSKSSTDIDNNTIPGSSDYVPESAQLLVLQSTNNKTTVNATNANVFDGISSNLKEKDPMVGNAQSPNPMLSNLPGGINPQVAMILRNNPRLQQLARQNPIIAQQIIRNPQLLRDPQIQREFFIFVFSGIKIETNFFGGKFQARSSLS